MFREDMATTFVKRQGCLLTSLEGQVPCGKKWKLQGQADGSDVI